MEGNKLGVGEEWFKAITQLTLSYRRNSDLRLKPRNVFYDDFSQQKIEGKLVKCMNKELVK